VKSWYKTATVTQPLVFQRLRWRSSSPSWVLLMALADLVRKQRRYAVKITKSFQPAVTITPWIGQDGGGNDSYGTRCRSPGYRGVGRPRDETGPDEGGRIMVVQATVYILVPIANTSATPDRFDRIL
jgi:hypothetical protein